LERLVGATLCLIEFAQAQCGGALLTKPSPLLVGEIPE
jgi:hypothetical protein